MTTKTIQTMIGITVVLVTMGSAAPSSRLGDEWKLQHKALSKNIKDRQHINDRAEQVYHPAALIHDSDRDPTDVVLRRTAALLKDLQQKPDAPDLGNIATALQRLQQAGRRVALSNKAARFELFVKACALRRRTAFSNPLLDFNRIVFAKHHRSIYNHMCDQYYGITAMPGGGLYVLSDPFGPTPRIHDILKDAVVQNGRLKGQQLKGGPVVPGLRYNGTGTLNGPETRGGSFLSPDLSFDGKKLVFAYVECQGDRTHRKHTDPSRGHWAEERCYHLFSVNSDGTDLRMLSDGTFNDFDPCWLPNGRIAFISERRGGYLRCGRVCPTYTLFDMAADGSDIRCLSYHETNEWHPSVTNDGMIIWTRWDYVDRHGRVAHHPWLTTPDGRDPRAVHGNYSLRPQRADMELDMRAIPNSHRFIGTAAPHHGQAYGSLILVDPQAQDNDVMSPVKRLTPDVGFPESQTGTHDQAYGTPWPLSDDYYLCVYDSVITAKEGVQGSGFKARNYGIYLMDCFGNRELLYRDPKVSSLSPMPLRSRTQPPVIPDKSKRIAADQPADAIVGVVDVYNSIMPWPKDTQIKALRIYQVLPQPLGSAHLKHETGYRIPQGSDSTNIARAILGTVPVEEDGSAYFTVPACKEVFFQALDKDGLAITSMRSATHFQPGERAVCQGCHESKQHTPITAANSIPLAMQRAPSRIQPDVDGTKPFSYPRLVQPVLNKSCVKCHAENPKEAPCLDESIVKDGKTSYYASYANLTPKFGFYNYGGKDWNDPKWYRTTPGQFGARASKLYTMLKEGHHDVKLSREDMHRITVWLDSCSLFYGVYEPEGGIAQLRGEIANPTLE
jgi:hypothetical protein